MTLLASSRVHVQICEEGSHRTENSRSITDIRNVTERLRVADNQTIPNAHGGGRDTGTSVHDRGTDDVRLHSTVRSGLEDKGIRLSIEHVLVDCLDVFNLGVVPDLALWVEIASGAKVDLVAAAADVEQFAFLAGWLCFLSCNDSFDEIPCERAASVDGDVVLFAEMLDLLDIAEVADYDMVCFQCRFKLIFVLYAAHICGHRPVWVGMFNGSHARCLNRKSDLKWR